MSVFGHDVVAVLLNDSLVHDVRFHKLANTTCLLDFRGDGLTHLFLTSENDDFCTFQCQILGDCTSENTRSASDDNHIVFDVE